MFKEWRVADVFGKALLGKYHNPESLVPDENGYLYICASNTNNGINKNMPRVNGQNLALTPSRIIAWGKQCPMFCYHDESCVTSQGMYYLDMRGYDEKVCLYICGVLSRTCAGKYGYSNCLIGKVLDETIISLPVIENPDPDHEYTVDDIDWQYMRDRIAELERDRIAELERDRIAELDAYLKVTGLDDYTLTDEDKKILSSLKEQANAKFKMFKVGELFNIHPTTAYKMKNNELFASDGTTPVLSNSSVDNGIGGYCGLAPTECGGMITFSDTTTGADTMFYQPNPFIGYPHVQGMYPYQSDRWNEKCCLYVISCIRKSAGNGWSYAVKFNRALVTELLIELPVIESSDPNHEYTVDDIDWQDMEHYIRAMEKVAIADVVRYKDRVIEETRKLVS